VLFAEGGSTDHMLVSDVRVRSIPCAELMPYADTRGMGTSHRDTIGALDAATCRQYGDISLRPFNVNGCSEFLLLG